MGGSVPAALGVTAPGKRTLTERLTTATSAPGRVTLGEGPPASEGAAPAAPGGAGNEPGPGLDHGAVPAVPQLPDGDRLDGPASDPRGEAGTEPAAGSSGGTPLPSEVRERLEARFGAPLDGVRVHTDGDAAMRAEAAGAHAFAVGQHIYFAAGKYAPGTPEGDKLIAHEVVHTIQAGAGGGASGQVSEPAEPAEREAESLADRPTDATRPVQPAHGVMRQPASAITPEVIAAMARRPRAGFARWSRLNEQQRNSVLAAMTANHGVPFAAAFLQAARNPGQRSHDVSTATDGQQVGFAEINAAWLTGQGYRLVGLVGGTGPQLWSRANGEEYYLLRRATSTPSTPPTTSTPPPSTTPPQPSPRTRQTQTTTGLNRILVDARFGIRAWFDDLREARDARNASDYASTRRGLLETLESVDRRTAELRREADELLRSDPAGRDPDLDVRILDQLDEIDDWRSEVTRQLSEFPETMPP